MLEGCCSRVVVTAGWNTGMTHSAWRQNIGVKIPAMTSAVHVLIFPGWSAMRHMAE